jgi:hypothetical protein
LLLLASLGTNQNVVYDLIHVSTIHNATIPSDDLLTPETQAQLSQLANDHEYNLAYNASDPIRAIAGSTLAVSIYPSSAYFLRAACSMCLNTLCNTPHAPKETLLMQIIYA